MSTPSLILVDFFLTSRALLNRFSAKDSVGKGKERASFAFCKIFLLDLPANWLSSYEGGTPEMAETRKREAGKNTKAKGKGFLGILKGHSKSAHVQRNDYLLSPFSQGWVFYLFTAKRSQTIQWEDQ